MVFGLMFSEHDMQGFRVMFSRKREGHFALQIIWTYLATPQSLYTFAMSLYEKNTPIGLNVLE